MWLLGSGIGLQVWTIGDIDPGLLVSVMVGEEAPIIMLNETIAGTPQEGVALRWAFSKIAEGRAGFYVRHF